MVPRIHLHVLASGSKGNATLVEGPEGLVLVDCGISNRELGRRAERLGLDLGRLCGVLVTHEHSDHVSGLSVLRNRFDGPMLATAGTVGGRPYLPELGFQIIDRSDSFELAGMRVRSFPTFHDVGDPVGYRFEAGGDVVGLCTDTGVLGDEAMGALHGARVLALESNHDPQMLLTGRYPAQLKERVAGERGHLSNDQAADALRELVTPDTECVVGMHLSQDNNRPSLCVRALAAAVGAQRADTTFTEARTPDGHLSVCVASQVEPRSIW